MNKNIITVIAVVVVLIFGIVFRHQIKTLALGGAQESPVPSSSSSPVPSVSEMPSITPETSPTVKPGGYHGRPTEELRPVPDEVKLFSEAQKKEIYRSLQNYGKTVRENPDFFDGWIQLGLLKKTIGDYEGARDAWEYAGVIRPKNSLSFGNLGELYWRYLHLYPQAEMNFKTSIQKDPHNPAMYVSLSDVYFYSIKEKSNLADDILLQGIAANPTSIDLVKALARLYEKSGQYANAIEWWQKVLATDPNNAGIIATIDALKKKLAGQ